MPVITQWHPIQQHLPSRGLIEALQQPSTGALPTAIQPCQCCHLTGAQLEGDILQDKVFGARGVGKGDVLEGDVALQCGRLRGAPSAHNWLTVQVVEDLVGSCHIAQQVAVGVCQRLCGAELLAPRMGTQQCAHGRDRRGDVPMGDALPGLTCTLLPALFW